MANPEHVRIVREGAIAIAAWRDAHLTTPLDLEGARLCSVNLREADLSGADLRRASLVGAGLKRASLCSANLARADLDHADLLRSDLTLARLGGACLVNAVLVNARLARANLHGANLMGANLTGAALGQVDFTAAEFSRTSLVDVDLSTAKGLESVRHFGPSPISILTFALSQGRIPDVFLRGCGVPETLIQNMAGLFGKALEFYSCFISHSSKDRAFAERLHDRMQGEGLRVWYAPEDMRGGRRTIDQVGEAIRIYDKFLLVLSEHSMNSDWVRTEIRLARRREKEQGRQLLFPIRLVRFGAVKAWTCFDADTGRDLAADVREYHISDFTSWKDHDSFEKALQGLLRDLRKGEK